MARSSPRRVLSGAGVVVVVALAVGCGSETTESTSTTVAAPTAQWSEQLLDAQAGADSPTVVAIDDEHVMVAFTTDSGVIHGFASYGDAPFEAGEGTETGLDFFALGGIAGFGDRWITVGSGGRRDGEEFEVRAFDSPDGRAWSPLETTGLQGPADVTGVVAGDDHVVAVGALRTADNPPRGGFQPVAWSSRDGIAWTRVVLPTGGAADGSVQAITETDGEILAVGQVGDSGVMWSSSDEGTTWQIVERDGVPPTSMLADIEAQSHVLVASGTTAQDGSSGEESAPVLLRSTDDGQTWSEVAEPPPSDRGNSFTFPISVGGGQFFGFSSSFIESWSEPELCYADIELCRQDSSISLYVSTDGDRWSRVDTSGIGQGEEGEIDDVLATDGGQVIALQRVADGTAAWTWPAGAPLPTTAEPVDPTSDVELLAEGEAPEPGQRYGVPLYIHCGMDWLYLGDEPWQRTDDGPDAGAGGEVPDDWPVAQQTIFGFVTLVEPDLIEYSIGDDEVIATYTPATVDPPPCA